MGDVIRYCKDGRRVTPNLFRPGSNRQDGGIRQSNGRAAPVIEPSKRKKERDKRREEVEHRAKVMLRTRLDEINEKAAKNVEKAIAKGSIDASIWWLEHVVKAEGTRLQQGQITKEVGKLDSEGLIALSEHVTRRVLDGVISDKQLKLINEAIGSHARLLGIREINALREQLATLEQQTRDASANRLMLNGYRPNWGRFRKGGPADPDVDDAEIAAQVLS
jgi:hypothetical protein